jgi:hypothetical protein
VALRIYGGMATYKTNPFPMIHCNKNLNEKHTNPFLLIFLWPFKTTFFLAIGCAARQAYLKNQPMRCKSIFGAFKILVMNAF